MQKKYKITKYYLITLLILLYFQMFNTSFASYEVIKATTVVDENAAEEKPQDYNPTFNDPELPNFSPEQSIGIKTENKIKNFFRKIRKDKNSEFPEEDVVQDGDTIHKQSEDKEAEVDVVENKNKFQINADKLYYDDESGNIFAKGNVEIIAKSQGVTLKADDVVLDKEKQTIKLQDNVKIIKDGVEMLGEYMLVDLNEENILMDNPTLDAYSFRVNAQEGYLIANDLLMLNGVLKNTKDMQYPFYTRGFMAVEPLGSQYINDKIFNDIELNPTAKKQAYKIKAKEIVLTSYKDHNSFQMNGSNLYYNNHKIVHNSDIEIISDKSKKVIETNLPELGTFRSFGTYLGYGMVFRLPKGQSFKLMPALTYGDSNIGIGAIGRYRTQNGLLEGGWNTSTTNIVARGRYRFNDSLSLNYGRNAYIPEGFMGARRSGYAAQLQYLKSYKNEDLDIGFNHGFYAGIFSEYEKHDQEHAFATTRFRYLAEISKQLFKIENKEQDMLLGLSAHAQGSATVYGTGDTAGVVRIGPVLTSRLKRWESNIGYMLGGIHGDSPFIFDKYRYGVSSILFNEKFNFNNKFALGYRAYISPLRDNYEEHLLTESRLYAVLGPNDLKVVLSYDFVREVAHIDFMFLIGSDNSKIEFDKLTTKDIDGANAKRDFYKNAKPVRIVAPENENI